MNRHQYNSNNSGFPVFAKGKDGYYYFTEEFIRSSDGTEHRITRANKVPRIEPVGGSTHGFPNGEMPPTKPDLSLLLIDLGGCRVIRMDEGRLPDALADKMTAKASDYGPYLTFQGVKQIQAAIDAMDTPPVPRIERSTDANYDFQLWCKTPEGNVFRHMFDQDELEAFEQLAGHPLPIYEKGGTWTLLKGSTVVGDGSGVKLWRYTK